jgi:hypothetical protein
MGVAGAIAGGVAAAGGIASAIGQRQQEKAQAEAAEAKGERRQELAKERAGVIMDKARDQAEMLEDKGQRIMGAQRAAAAGSGVQMAGSAEAVVDETQANIERDVNRILERGKQQASLTRERGRIAAKAGEERADTILTGSGWRLGGNIASSLVSGASTAAGFA